MKPIQSSEITNAVIKELTGETDLVAKDLSNIVDIGATLKDKVAVDEFVKALAMKIGKTIFEVSPYRSLAPNIKKESFEWGGIIEKIKFKNVEFKDDPKYSLNAGDNLPLAKYMPPVAESVYYQNRDTGFLEITLPVKNRDFQQYFRDAQTYNNFITSIHDVVRNAISKRMDAVAFSTMNRMIVDTLTDTKVPTTKVKLVSKYNEIYKPTNPITSDNALFTPSFLQFAIAEISKVYGDMRFTTKLFNLNKYETNMYGRENLLILSDFENNIKRLLKPDVYNDQLLNLPGYSTIPIWQGWGLDGSFAKKSTVTMKVGKEDKTYSNIVAIAYDGDALGTYNDEVNARMGVNDPTGYTNLYYDLGISAYNDHDKNFVVFTLD